MFVFQLPLLKNTDCGLKNVFLGKLNGTPPPSERGQGAMCENGVKNLEHPVADWAGPDI